MSTNKLVWILTGILFLAPVPALGRPQVVDTYVKPPYKFTCIMIKRRLNEKVKYKYCGNWNVVS
jgi:hypothetical protein